MSKFKDYYLNSEGFLLLWAFSPKSQTYLKQFKSESLENSIDEMLSSERVLSSHDEDLSLRWRDLSLEERQAILGKLLKKEQEFLEENQTTAHSMRRMSMGVSAVFMGALILGALASTSFLAVLPFIACAIVAFCFTDCLSRCFIASDNSPSKRLISALKEEQQDVNTEIQKLKREKRLMSAEGENNSPVRPQVITGRPGYTLGFFPGQGKISAQDPGVDSLSPSLSLSPSSVS